MLAQTQLTPERIVEYIDRHFAEPLTPQRVARAMHYSLCHLTHFSRKCLGVCVSDLILRRRIDEAKHLLAETPLDVSTIARRVGFSGPAYFSRRFSEATGMPPSRWRRLSTGKHPPARCHACGTTLSKLR